MEHSFINKKDYTNMKKNLSVTIGIPAYNEEANIGRLLKSILNQSKTNFNLEKVIVICDGCTDNTSKIIQDFSKKYSMIKLMDDNKRLGKRKRLNNLYRSNMSDVYITFDGDVVLSNRNVIEEIVKEFKSEKVGLVGGFNLPFAPNNIFEKIIVTWINFWNETRKDLNNGINVHNHLGCVSAIRKDLVKRIQIPEKIVADDDYLFFQIINLGYEFRFAKKAIVYYKSVDNLKDFLNQHARLLEGKIAIAEHFGNWVYKYYRVDQKKKIKSLVKIFLNDPIYLVFALLLQIILRIKMATTKKNQQRYWQIAKSSKKASLNN